MIVGVGINVRRAPRADVAEAVCLEETLPAPVAAGLSPARLAISIAEGLVEWVERATRGEAAVIRTAWDALAEPALGNRLCSDRPN